MENTPPKLYSRIRNYVAISLVAVILGILLGGCDKTVFQTLPDKVKDFRGKLIDGEMSSYQAQKAKATLIVLTASWCPGCRQELPHLKNLDAQFKGQNFKILLISEDDSPKIAARYNKQTGITWTTFHWNYEIMNALGNPGVIPVSYLVDSKDSIVKINVGNFDEKEMVKLIENILEE